MPPLRHPTPPDRNLVPRATWRTAGAAADLYVLRNGKDTGKGASMSPTERTLKYLRNDLGMVAQVVERWNQFSRVRQDVYGFGDILAHGEDRGVWLVQATSTGNMAARVRKIREEPRSWSWLRSGGRIVVIGWAKRGARGKRKVWTPRLVEVLLTQEVELEEAA